MLVNGSWGLTTFHDNSGNSERLNSATVHDPAYMVLRDRMAVDKAYKKGFTSVEPDEDWREDLKGEDFFFKKGHRDRASRFFSWYICIQQWLPIWLTSYFNGSLQWIISYYVVQATNAILLYCVEHSNRAQYTFQTVDDMFDSHSTPLPTCCKPGPQNKPTPQPFEIWMDSSFVHRLVQIHFRRPHTLQTHTCLPTQNIVY